MCEMRITTRSGEHDDVALYKAKCNALSRELDDAVKENDKLRKVNRHYRKDRFKAYTKGLTGDREPIDKYICALCWAGGMVTSFIITTVIIVLKAI